MQATQIRSLVDQFVTDLQQIIRAEALDAVGGALGEGPPRRGPGRPRKAAKRGAGRPKKTGGRPRKADRRSQADVSALADQVLAHVRSNPGLRLEEIGRELGVSTGDLKRPVANLLEAGAVRTEGKARGTKYYAGGGGGQKAKASKKKTGKRATKKKTTRKADKKATAKRATKKTRRKLSPEQKAVLVERLAKARAAKQAAG